MASKNILSLHEAIVIALINIDNERYIASFEDIAHYIDDRGLYTFRKGKVKLSTQVMLRSTKSKGAYRHLFQQIDRESIGLRLTGKSKRQKTRT